MEINYFYKLLFCALIISCETFCSPQGHGGVSENLNESRKRNVFVAEYEVNPNPYFINDSLQIYVTNAWLENQWSFGKSEDKIIIIENEFQLVIEVKSGSLRNYGLQWRIGISGDRYIRSCGKNCLISDFTELPRDVEEWKVQSGSDLDSLSHKNIIGTFKIRKKISKD